MSLSAPFAYYGGKARLAADICALLPSHRHYVEPFAGSLAVLLAKPRAPMETVNDLDGDLMTFWRVLRDSPDELRERMELTPHSRAEFALARERGDELDDIERARRVWVLLSQSRSGTLRRTGWRHYVDSAGSSVGMPDYLAGYARRVPACAERLRGVSLECRPALDVVASYGRADDVLLYCDPPYLGSSRNSTGYQHEMPAVDEHRALADALHGAASAVVVSGYASPLYEELYGDWYRVALASWTGNGLRDGRGRADGVREEILWSNHPLGQPDLFAELAL